MSSDDRIEQILKLTFIDLPFEVQAYDVFRLGRKIARLENMTLSMELDAVMKFIKKNIEVNSHKQLGDVNRKVESWRNPEKDSWTLAAIKRPSLAQTPP